MHPYLCKYSCSYGCINLHVIIIIPTYLNMLLNMYSCVTNTYLLFINLYNSTICIIN